MQAKKGETGIAIYFNIGKMGVSETGVGEPGQIIGETGIAEME